RATLSNRAWKRRCGCCLALRYSTRCKARDGSRPSAFAVDLARMRALTDPLLEASRVDEAGALPSGRVVLSRAIKRYYDPLRLPGGCRLYAGAASRTPQARGHRGPLQFPRHPSDRSTPPTPEGSLAPAPGSQVPSMAFAIGIQARLPLGRLRGDSY